METKEIIERAFQKETPIGKQIAAAFVKAQKAFGPALKTSTNPHFRSKYADLSNCVEAVIGALNDNGIGLMQRTYESKDGVMVETVFIHESGEIMECGLLHVPASKQDPQGYGSALTYARRYSLLAATGLAPEDDDGNSASRRPTVESKVNANQMADHIAAIDASASKEELQTTYAAAYAACDGDQAWQAKVIKAKAERIAKAKKEKENGN
ncbi:Essential recombination function protein [uncultured Caudovirales phage]|uniref:Essential recombination function protein n=1 Tax=uncultured Caudovirales phage TaxID=2100421 RepID=A0A6J5T850_9CAUD|nr:Essential recombination function protein [uncultured Caudovirales phage]